MNNSLSSMIVPGVLWGLVLFSVVSWAILLVKSAQYLRQKAKNKQFSKSFWGEPHLMRPERAGRGPVPGPGRQMLAQRPASGHVEQLHSAADAEYRQPVCQRSGEQLQFRLITLGVDPARPRIRLRPIAGGVDVAAARENEPVQPGQGARDAGHRRQQHGHTASLGDLFNIAGREQRGRSVPASPLGRLGVRGQSDDSRKSHSGVT